MAMKKHCNKNYTCAANGVTIAPILADDDINPNARPLTLVGYTSVVYTYATWYAPDAKVLVPKRNTVNHILHNKSS